MKIKLLENLKKKTISLFIYVATQHCISSFQNKIRLLKHGMIKIFQKFVNKKSIIDLKLFSSFLDPMYITIKLGKAEPV